MVCREVTMSKDSRGRIKGMIMLDRGYRMAIDPLRRMLIFPYMAQLEKTP
jgi:hypothetical protein